MSRAHITDIVVLCAAILAIGLYAGLILRPAWSSYPRLWERLTASLLSLYVLAVLLGAGVVGALAVVYYWA